MRVSQAVFGVFHHFELARELERRGLLDTVYSSWPWRRLKREGLPHARVKTFPWIQTPEYLVGRAGIFPLWLADELGYQNALRFDDWTSSRVGDVDALIAISGAALKTGRQLQQRGGIFICDRGSSHQTYQAEIIADEFRRWGLAPPHSDPRDIAREEEIYEAADAITIASSFSYRSFLACGVPEHKLHRIPLGVRLETFSKTAEPARGTFEVLFAGQVSLRKGIPYLLQAFAALQHPRKRLRIAGAVAPEIKTLLAELPQQHVEFLGSIAQAELSRKMSESHLLVLPSIEDGFGMVLSQAMACGCPILATTNTGGDDLITDGVEGFIVPIRDAAALTARMQQLADDPALQQQMSEAALARVQHIGGWRQYGDEWEALLRKLASSR
ncbi:MAG TPA: glycosyltransferase family 4 protein [Acidobacteriaceae bacterium]|nr:glycosyltransferase family 4 protein [Acidobacteriaceae bacterium]